MSDTQFNNGLLPEFLRTRAYISSNGEEFALPPDAAIEYLQWMRQQGIETEFFEVWRPTVPGPTVCGIAVHGDVDKCIEAVPKVIAEEGSDIVFNIWTHYLPY
jgi:hypothetical protein